MPKTKIQTDPAFRDAMRANPDDDTVRLVYADWLEEHGEAYIAAKMRWWVLARRAILAAPPMWYQRSAADALNDIMWRFGRIERPWLRNLVMVTLFRQQKSPAIFKLRDDDRELSKQILDTVEEHALSLLPVTEVYKVETKIKKMLHTAWIDEAPISVWNYSEIFRHLCLTRPSGWFLPGVISLLMGNLLKRRGIFPIVSVRYLVYRDVDPEEIEKPDPLPNYALVNGAFYQAGILSAPTSHTTPYELCGQMVTTPLSRQQITAHRREGRAAARRSSE